MLLLSCCWLWWICCAWALNAGFGLLDRNRWILHERERERERPTNATALPRARAPSDFATWRACSRYLARKTNYRMSRVLMSRSLIYLPFFYLFHHGVQLAPCANLVLWNHRVVWGDIWIARHLTCAPYQANKSKRTQIWMVRNMRASSAAFNWMLKLLGKVELESNYTDSTSQWQLTSKQKLSSTN